MRKFPLDIFSVVSFLRLKTLVAAILVFVLSVTSCHYLESKPISVAAHIWPGYEPMFLARSEGWLSPDLVTLVETASATESMQALLDGRIDAAALTLDEAIKVRAMGMPLTVVMVFNTSVGADMLLADSNIKTMGDIKGKRLGYEASSLGAVMLVKVLQSAQLEKGDVHLVELNIDKHLTGWQQRKFDAVITYEPVATQLLANGMHKLFDSRQIPNTIMDVLVIRNDAINYRQTKALRHLIASHFRALSHLKHNPQDTAYRIADHLKLEAGQVLGAYKGLLLPDIENNYRLLVGKEGKPQLLTSANELMLLMQKHQLIQTQGNMSLLVDDQYLPRDYEVTYE